jgi:hypothetical protein
MLGRFAHGALMTDNLDAKRKNDFWVLRPIGIVFAAIYPVLVGALAIVKLATPYQGMPWPEVFYGPALTLGSVWTLVAIGTWIEVRFW